jgi:amino acid transporter
MAAQCSGWPPRPLEQYDGGLLRPPPLPDRLSTLGLAAATFFIVSGGPYGLEEVVLGHGYAGALLLLAVVPFVWSLPVALLVGELGAALPATGGFYAWVRRALGPFWGLQEAWLSLAVGIVDIAIYPTLLAAYLGRFWPALAGDQPGQAGWWLGVAAIAGCTGWNALGIRSIGRGSAVLGAALLAPFLALLLLALARLPAGGLEAARAAFSARPPADDGALAAGLMLAMWNLMGFDNASTFAAEVREPGRSYPRAMLAATLGIAAAYLVTVLAASVSGLPPAGWSSGSWVEVGRRLGGPALGAALTAGGALSAVGMYAALLLSWSRLPVALAEDGFLPAALARRSPRTHAPVAAVLLGGALSTLCLGLGLRRLVEIDVLLYGAALLLELWSVVALRLREPGLARPFRIPGGTIGVAALMAPPALLLGLAGWMGRDEPGAFGLSAVGLAAAVATVGVAWWMVRGLAGRTAAR